jgi:hypothetical protein
VLAAVCLTRVPVPRVCNCHPTQVDMTRDVIGQLQRISGQQSRIRDMRNKLAAFSEVRRAVALQCPAFRCATRSRSVQ